MKSPINPTNEAERRRVLIVDDHAVLREGLALVINAQPDLLVCGEAGDVSGGLQSVTTTHPDVALVDLSLMGGSGLELGQGTQGAPSSSADAGIVAAR